MPVSAKARRVKHFEQARQAHQGMRRILAPLAQSERAYAFSYNTPQPWASVCFCVRRLNQPPLAPYADHASCKLLQKRIAGVEIVSRGFTIVAPFSFCQGLCAPTFTPLPATRRGICAPGVFLVFCLMAQTRAQRQNRQRFATRTTSQCPAHRRLMHFAPRSVPQPQLCLNWKLHRPVRKPHVRNDVLS